MPTSVRGPRGSPSIVLLRLRFSFELSAMPPPSAAARAPVARAGPFAFLAAVPAALPVSRERPLDGAGRPFDLVERPAELRERLEPEFDEAPVRDLLAPLDLLAAGLGALLARVVLRSLEADEPLRRGLLAPLDFEPEALPDFDAARLLEDEELLAAGLEALLARVVLRPFEGARLAAPEERWPLFCVEPVVLARPDTRRPFAVSSAST